MAVIETLKDKASILKDKAGMVMSSVGDLNKFAIDKVEDATKLNLSSASYFSDVSLKQMRAVSAIKDIDSLRKFTADSISLSGEMAKKMLDDSKAWMMIGADIKGKITEVFTPKEETAVKKKAAVKSAA